mgnify:CR=1 FL=1
MGIRFCLPRLFWRFSEDFRALIDRFETTITGTEPFDPNGLPVREPGFPSDDESNYARRPRGVENLDG